MNLAFFCVKGIKTLKINLSDNNRQTQVIYDIIFLAF